MKKNYRRNISHKQLIKFSECKFCKSQLSPKAIICPNCQKYQKNPWATIQKYIPVSSLLTALTSIALVIVASLQVKLAYKQSTDSENALRSANKALESADSLKSSMLKTVNIMDSLKVDTKKNFDIISIITKELEKRNELTRIADLAIGDGKRNALQKLRLISDTTKTDYLKTAAESEIGRIFSYYIAYWTDFQIKNEQSLKTSELLEILRSDKDWKNRVASAQALSRKKESFYEIEILMERLRVEQDLRVLKVIIYRLMEYTQLSGVNYEGMGNFNFEYFYKWWNEYRNILKDKLKIKK